MARYFTHIRSSRGLATDVEGAEFFDLGAAIHDAVEGAREMIADAARDGRNMLDSRFEICGADGKLLVAMPFTTALMPHQGPDVGKPH